MSINQEYFGDETVASKRLIGIVVGLDMPPNGWAGRNAFGAS